MGIIIIIIIIIGISHCTVKLKIVKQRWQVYHVKKAGLSACRCVGRILAICPTSVRTYGPY